MNNKKTIGIAIIIIFVIGGGVVYLNDNSNSQFAGSVDNVKISKADYQIQINRMNAFYTYSKQAPSVQSSLQKDTLEMMINNTLVQNYANKHAITATDTEVQRRYNQVVVGFNRNNKIEGNGEELFLARIKKMYGSDKNTYLDQVRMDIVKEKVQAKVKMPLARWLIEQKKSSHIIRN